MNKRVLMIAVLVMVMTFVITACKKKPNAAEPTVVPTETTIATEAEETTGQTLETLEVIYDPQVEDLGDDTIDTKPTETKPEEAKPQETKPQETQPAETEPTVTDPMALEYESYLKKTPAEQQTFYETFDSPDAFIAWYNSAKAAYDANQNYIDISGGNIDFGDLG